MDPVGNSQLLTIAPADLFGIVAVLNNAEKDRKEFPQMKDAEQYCSIEDTRIMVSVLRDLANSITFGVVKYIWISDINERVSNLEYHRKVLLSAGDLLNPDMKARISYLNNEVTTSLLSCQTLCRKPHLPDVYAAIDTIIHYIKRYKP